MIFRVRYKKLGCHYYCRVFSARVPNNTFAKLGTLCLSEDDWDDFQLCAPGFEYISEQEIDVAEPKL